jgi:hypothetical protein
MPFSRCAVAACAALLTAGAAAAPAPAPDPFPGTVGVQGGRLLVSLDLASAFPPSLRKQLENGLTHVVAVHLSVVPERGQDPLAMYGREIEVLYDVWREEFRATVRDSLLPAGRRLTFPDFGALLAFLSALRGVDLCPSAALAAERWVVVARVEVDPVSEIVDRTRELIAGGGSPGLLSSVASALLHAPVHGPGARTFRSAPFAARDGAVR